MEMAFLMRECDRRLQQAPEDFASLLRQLPWQTPSHVVGLQGPASRARLLQSARFPDKSYKGKAAHLMQLLPMIACLVELLDEEDQMAGPLASYECLLEIHRELSRLKRLGQISDTSKLQQLQRQHHDLCLTTYGKGILKPKHHWRHHAAKQIEEWGAYMDTSAFEAKHQAYKQTANKNFDVLVSSPAWSKAILDRMLCSCVDQMKVHFERRALLGRGKETTISSGASRNSGHSSKCSGRGSLGRLATSSWNLSQAKSCTAVSAPLTYLSFCCRNILSQAKAGSAWSFALLGGCGNCKTCCALSWPPGG